MNEFPALSDENVKKMEALRAEVENSFQKQQVYRTEAQMRYAVLNDNSFPTKAGKYWQCVREQASMYENLVWLSFEFRKDKIDLEKTTELYEKTSDKYEKQLLEIEIDKIKWRLENAKRVGNDRVREIEAWSKLKKELDDGTFDTENVETNKLEDMYKSLLARADVLAPHHGPSEILNVHGPLDTIKKNIDMTMLDAEHMKRSLNGNTKK